MMGHNFLTPCFRLLLAGWVFLGFSLVPAFSQDVSAVDEASFRKIISGQINAFKSGEFLKAYSYASAAVKQKFPNAEVFTTMAKVWYAPAYNPQSFTFGTSSRTLGMPTQHVDIVGPQGKYWTALYGFEMQNDGGWRIVVVRLLERPGAGA
jgi:hypothetical protein